MNSSNLIELYRQKNQLKKKKDKYCRRFYCYTTFPWLILAISLLASLFLDLVFKLDWKKTILDFLGLAIFFMIITAGWGLYLASKIWKYSQKIALIDEKIIAELSRESK